MASHAADVGGGGPRGHTLLVGSSPSAGSSCFQFRTTERPKRARSPPGSEALAAGADSAAGCRSCASADAGAGVGVPDHAMCPIEAEGQSEADQDRPGKKVCLGPIAAAAADQWCLDKHRLEAWAVCKGLPGVGLADLVDYRRENPEEDISAELSECGLREATSRSCTRDDAANLTPEAADCRDL
ncbi:unnamed protein product [Polarella glacialis]|uniref:Uncharacterized protein n=1 Tax=Polarella glacialis TaxID=89957 RepID=A0A813KZX0_POLGL|nr:unnamed protein product [Polarella glacialis]